MKNMTPQAILLIKELLVLTMKLRPWTDVVSQNSFTVFSNIMTPKKKMSTFLTQRTKSLISTLHTLAKTEIIYPKKYEGKSSNGAHIR